MNKMTNSEARQILIDHNAWRHSNKADYLHSASAVNLAIDAAIVALGDNDMLSVYLLGYFDGKRSKSSIAQAIRDAAVNWPQNIAFVEHGILDAFQEWDAPHWWTTLINNPDIQAKNQARTFMLLVAEALES